MTTIIKAWDVQKCIAYRNARIKTMALYAKREYTADDILTAVQSGISIGAFSGSDYAIGVSA